MLHKQCNRVIDSLTLENEALRQRVSALEEALDAHLMVRTQSAQSPGVGKVHYLDDARMVELENVKPSA